MIYAIYIYINISIVGLRKVYAMKKMTLKNIIQIKELYIWSLIIVAMVILLNLFKDKRPKYPKLSEYIKF